MKKIIRLLLLFFLACTLHLKALAENISIKIGTEWINDLSANIPSKSDLNIDNSLLKIPSFLGKTQVNGDFYLNFSEKFNFVLRPRLRIKMEKTYFENEWHKDQWLPEAYWNEIFAHVDLTDNISLIYGAQNFQWGDAELLSPSNSIFNDPVLNRTAIAETPGKMLGRIHLSLGKQWSFVGIVESEPFAHPDRITAANSFRKGFLIKTEYTDANGASYIGATISDKQSERYHFGEYGGLLLTDVWSIYFDAEHHYGSKTFYPVFTANGPTFSQSKLQSSTLYTSAVLGLKYAFEKASEARIELLGLQEGYTQSQFDDAINFLKLLPKDSLASLLNYGVSGTELPGQKYVYFGYRSPEFGSNDMFMMNLRYLHSMTDHSGVFFANLESKFTEDSTTFTTFSISQGKKNSELNRYIGTSFLLGYKRSF